MEQPFVDTVLPFRLRSTPKIFSAVADALKWILTQQGVSHSIHYLDDFFTVGSSTSSECNNNLHWIMETCKLLGIPLAPEKIVGPTCQLTFLGIEIHSESLQLCLPQKKIGKTETANKCKMVDKGKQLPFHARWSHLEEHSSGASSICHVFQKTWTTGFANYAHHKIL